MSEVPGRAQDDDCQTAPVATPRRVRLLSRGEYLSVAANLLGPKAHDLSDLVPEDVRIRGVDNPADAVSVTPGRLDGYAAFAEKAAAAADVSALAPCPMGQSENDCAGTFVRQFGRRAFGRPLDDAEVARFTEVFRIGREGQDYPAGIRLVIETLLQSPGFLYALELGEGDPPAGGETVPLTDHELASRLSFTLSGSRPDDQLLEAADQGAAARPRAAAASGGTDPGPARSPPCACAISCSGGWSCTISPACKRTRFCIRSSRPTFGRRWSRRPNASWIRCCGGAAGPCPSCSPPRIGSCRRPCNPSTARTCW